jgi:hypothetical protein
VAQFVAHLLATAAPWVRIRTVRTYISQKYNMAASAKELLKHSKKKNK